MGKRLHVWLLKLDELFEVAKVLNCGSCCVFNCCGLSAAGTLPDCSCDCLLTIHQVLAGMHNHGCPYNISYVWRDMLIKSPPCPVRFMLELKFTIYYRAASLPSQASYAVLAEESQAFFKHSPHTNSIPNSAILHNNYISLLSDLCACVHVKKKWHRKGSHSSSVSGSNRLAWLQTWRKAMG